MRVEGGSNSGACHPEAFRRDAQKLAGGVPCGQRNLIRFEMAKITASARVSENEISFSRINVKMLNGSSQTCNMYE